MKRAGPYMGSDYVLEGESAEAEAAGAATADLIREALAALTEQMDRFGCPEMAPTGFIVSVRPLFYEGDEMVTLSLADEADGDQPPRK